MAKWNSMATKSCYPYVYVEFYWIFRHIYYSHWKRILYFLTCYIEYVNVLNICKTNDEKWKQKITIKRIILSNHSSIYQVTSTERQLNWNPRSLRQTAKSANYGYIGEIKRINICGEHKPDPNHWARKTYCLYKQQRQLRIMKISL
jgi:hypothetical protein